MGYGGYLTWTAVAREIYKKANNPKLKILPCEATGNKITKIVKSEIFTHNPYIHSDEKGVEVFPLQLNNPETNYCKLDTPERCVQRCDKHCIEQICEYYGIENPELKCELYFSDQEKEKINKFVKNLEKDFIVVEPHSKKDYTPNKEYSFEKWNNIVQELAKEYQVVQVGNKNEEILDNVVDLVGQTTFKEAAGIIEKSRLFMSTEGGLGHASTAVGTTALIVITGYESPVLWAYPQNINVFIGTHGPCGLKIPCEDCYNEVKDHNEKEIIEKSLDFLKD